MNKNILPVKGTHDIYGSDINKFNFIIKKFYSLTKKYNFHPIQTPIIEHQELFSRSVGEFTDIVSKEMYSFVDKGDSLICLRPEATSGIARFASSNYQNGSLKLSTHGPMFRRERPQKGRYRQFHQINIENIGEKSPYTDFEIIYIAHMLFKKLGLNKDQYKIQINSLGSEEDQKKYSKILKDFFTTHKNKLSETSIIRLENNPLRILDSKEEGDKELIIKAPSLSENLSQDSTKYFFEVKLLLKDNGIEFNEDDRLVRGLDYYTHTAFEFQTIEDKRQNAILAGGRYDKLINMISSRDIPGIGWAAGIERIMNLLPIEQSYSDISKKILLAVQDEKYISSNILEKIFESDFSHEVKINKNIKKLFSYADRNDFDFLVLIAEEEFKLNSITFKDLKKKNQKRLKISEFALSNEVR
tara:strand:- start:1330 stop:2574 length:1245 start_codon:yes stop_codon:yes gene_type:complete